jgi:hypothetical protein
MAQKTFFDATTIRLKIQRFDAYSLTLVAAIA